MLNVYNVSKRFKGVKALENINIDFDSNKIYGLLGRNGAGKTTLINVISNFTFANVGLVEIDNEIVNKNTKLFDKVHVMSQTDNYNQKRYVDDYFIFIAKINEKFDLELARRYASEFDLNIKSRIKELSFGYQTIFKLCVALAHNTPYVIYDEPVVGLDLIHRELFYSLVLEQYTRLNNTIVIASHIIDEMENIVDNIIVIDHGKVLLDMTYQDLIDKVYLLSGKREDILKVVDATNIIYEEKIGELSNIYLIGYLDTSLLENIQISRLGLQEIFMALTSEGRY